jgi:hypothetical protein
MELGSEPMELGSEPMELGSEPMELGSEPFELLRLGSEVCRQCRALYFMVYARVVNLSAIIPQYPQSHAPDIQVIRIPVYP